MGSGAIYDKTGREIMLWDVLKVFHFTGARNKRHYMYKHVVGERVLGSGNSYWFLSHLDPKEDGYLLAKDGTVYKDYEIVQGLDYFPDRPRIALNPKEGEADGR